MKDYVLRTKFWINDFLHGSKMRKNLKEIEYIYNNFEKGEQIRKKKLENLLEYALKNVPYYQFLGINSTELKNFPIMNKNIYIDNYSQFCVPLEKIPNQKGKLFIASTSGSTGIPFKVPQDTECRTRRIATIKFENKLLGYKEFQPLMHFRPFKQYYPDFIGTVIFKKNLNIYYVDNSNLTTDKLSIVLEILNKKKIKIIRGYMTSLQILVDYAIENNIELIHHPTFISGGELLQESLRKKIVEKLQCSVVSQYANEECGVFGKSETNKIGSKIILNRANSIIEILKFNEDKPVDKGELGRIVVTDLTNYAFPMIRYEIGDIATIGEQTAEGNVLSIEKLYGRKTDMIFKPNGDFINIWLSMPKEIMGNSAVKQWQFIQKSEKKYLLKLVTTDKLFMKRENDLIEMMKTILGETAVIQIEFVDTIPVLNSGKQRVIINEMLRN